MGYRGQTCLKCSFSARKNPSCYKDDYWDPFQTENLQKNAASNWTLLAAHTQDWSDRHAIIRTVSTGHKGEKM